MLKYLKKYKIPLLIIIFVSVCLLMKNENLEMFTSDRKNKHTDMLYNHNVCPKVPPFPELSMFANNLTSSECCKTSPYSSSNGCICVCQEQMDYLASRGGNKAKCFNDF